MALEHGSLTDNVKTRKLDERIPIRPEVLDASPVFGQICLCDYEPPLPFTMFVVHRAIVCNLTPDESEQYNLDGQVDKEFTVSEVQSWSFPYAFKKADGRDPAIPKVEWIKKAVTRLIEMGWVDRSKGSNERFVYHHKKGRKGCNNPLGRYVEVWAKHLQEIEEKKEKRKKREEQRRVKVRETLKRRFPLLAGQIDEELGEPTNSDFPDEGESTENQDPRHGPEG